MSAGREARAGACGQALNKPEGRKPWDAPMQGEFSWLMAIDVSRCLAGLQYVRPGGMPDGR
jgi:hypothetical protein